ncbi:hypothetical protein AB1Y20_003243 [Prymnesium parvum]|uniref:Uncharacterized protein n=1 Tax=Prymnesium parvum TaxID=97485 RepID=A0AB34JCG4_PRYPA
MWRTRCSSRRPWERVQRQVHPSVWKKRQQTAALQPSLQLQSARLPSPSAPGCNPSCRTHVPARREKVQSKVHCWKGLRSARMQRQVHRAAWNKRQQALPHRGPCARSAYPPPCVHSAQTERAQWQAHSLSQRRLERVQLQLQVPR